MISHLVSYRRRRVIKLSSTLACIGLYWLGSGCLTPRIEPESAQSNTMLISQDDDVPDLGDIDSSEFEMVDENAAEATLSAAGFCRDDIYTKYLVNQYLAKEGSSSSTPSKKSKNIDKRALDRRALHFAATRIKGLSSPYFGGMPIVANQRVESWLRYYKTTGRSTFLKWIVRGQGMRNIIESGLRNEGVPVELYYLAMVESGFNNRAFSRAKATGTWQFMEPTAKLYGLQVGHWVDERRDPSKSTIAAARYLKQLYGKFGDWYLAIAAYNAGPGKIARAIARAKTRDFWQLAETDYIKDETKNYVPKVLAAITLGSNASAHGIQFHADPKDELPTSTVYIHRPVLISELAQAINTPVSQIQHWNPELQRDITPPTSVWRNRPGYELRVPKRLKDRLMQVEAKLTHLEIQDFKIHVVGRGETLTKIAKRYQITVGHILSLNPDISARSLRIGKSISIPIPAVVSKRKDVT